MITTSKRTAVRLIGFALVAGATATAYADVGDVVHQIDAPVPIEDKFCSIGLAFDGTYLYYDRCSDRIVYIVDPISGDLVDTIVPEIPEMPNAMAYDASRNGLWIGTQNGEGADGFSCGDLGLPVYFYDFDDGSTAHAFTIPLGLVNPATGLSFAGFCFNDGLAFNLGDPGDPTDDEIWYSDDVNRNVGLFSTAGALIEGYDASTVDASLSSNSGLAVGGPNLYMGNNGGGDVFRADINSDPLAVVDMFTSGDDRQEDMECDPVTFNNEEWGFKEVMWVRTTPQGGAFPDVMTAYEIEPGTCGVGGQSFCGDGNVDPGEQCDDGNNDAGDGCSPRCTIEECGNGILDPGEQCDDGNLDDGDGCSANCTIEGEVCGCEDLDGDGWVTYYGPCPPDVGAKHNRWLPECESFNDCDDTDPTIHPLAMEIPNDGIDQNCNGIMKCGAVDDDVAAGWALAAFALPLGAVLAIRRRLRGTR